MKQKNFLVFIFILLSISLNAQLSTDNAIGLRAGNNDGLAFEFSYQRHISENQHQRLEFGLGFKDSNDLEYLKLIGFYQFISKLTGDYRWYMGAGGGLINFANNISNGNSILTAGIIGVEYSETNLPILFSLDFRPEYVFNDDYSDSIGFDIGLSIRIQF